MALQPNESFGITELSRTLGISGNMTFRVLSILNAYRYTECDPSGKYRLSSKMYSIGTRLGERLNLDNCAQPWLDRLCRVTGEVAHMQVADGKRCLLAASAEPARDFYFYVKRGSRLHYHPNAFGKAMLAFFNEDTFKLATSEGLPALTPHTITDIDALNRSLEETRRTGFAYDIEEYNSGVFCVGAPVFDVNGTVVAGVGIISFISALDERGYKGYQAPVLDCAKNISLSIGYDGNLFETWEKLLPVQNS